jgi:hypothetical protein
MKLMRIGNLRVEERTCVLLNEMLDSTSYDCDVTRIKVISIKCSILVEETQLVTGEPSEVKAIFCISANDKYCSPLPRHPKITKTV